MVMASVLLINSMGMYSCTGLSHYKFLIDYHKAASNTEAPVIVKTVEVVLQENQSESSDKDFEETPYERDIKLLDEITDKKEWIKGYIEVCRRYDIPLILLEDVLSDEDLDYLYRMVETETFDAEFEGKIHVANVAFNRFDDGRFGDTIGEIIKAKNQFAYGRRLISEDTILACEYAWIVGDLTQGALYFDSNTVLGKKHKFLFTDSIGHNFYK